MRLRSAGGARHNQQSEALCSSSMPSAWHTRALQSCPASTTVCSRPSASRQHRRRLHQRAAIDHRLELELSDSSIARSLPHNAGLLEPQDLDDGMGVAPTITPRKRINRVLKRAGSLLELRVILEQESLSFDAVNTSHAMHRLAKMHRSLCSSLAEAGMLTADMVAQHRAEHVSPCLEVLDVLVRTHIHQMEAWDVAISLWSYAVLDHYDRHMFDLLCSRALQLTDVMNPADCANILIAFGRWGHYQPDLLKSMPQVLLDHMYDAKPLEVAQCLWGFARLKVPGAPGRTFLLACCETIHASMYSYSSQDLTTVLWALTRLQFYPGLAFLQRSESILLKRLRAMVGYKHRLQAASRPLGDANGHAAGHRWPTHAATQPHAAHGVHPAPPAAGHTPAPSMLVGQAAGPPVSVVQLEEEEHDHEFANGHELHVHAPEDAPLHQQLLSSQDVAMALYSFGRMRYKAVLVLDELPLSLGMWLHEFSSTDLCCMVSGYATARHYHQGVLEAVAPLITVRVHSLNVSQLATVLVSYGVFQHRPVSDPYLIPAVANALTNRLRSCRPQTFALIAKACANLQCRPEPLLQAVVQGSFERLADFKPEEMAHLLYGLSFLVSRAPACELPAARHATNATSSVRGGAAAVNGSGSPGAQQAAGGAAGGSRVALAGLHPALRPEEMQLFYGVVRQCMRLLDEPSHVYASAQHLNHQVLNSIIFSCSRVGYTPWALIEFAETKGFRLTNPKANGPVKHGRSRAARPPSATWEPHDTDSSEALSSSSSQGVRSVAAADTVVDGAQVEIEVPPAALVTLPGEARRGQHTAPPLTLTPSPPCGGSGQG